MIKAAVARTPILVFIVMFFALGYTVAHNKVVVVPLGSVEPTLDIFYGSATSAGVLEQGNLASATRSAQGNYTVTINRTLEGCNAVATAGSYISGVADLWGTVSASVLSSSGYVRVRNYHFNGSSYVSNDTDFHITLTCAKI